MKYDTHRDEIQPIYYKLINYLIVLQNVCKIVIQVQGERFELPKEFIIIF
mgnify:CR=1 FL=1